MSTKSEPPRQPTKANPPDPGSAMPENGGAEPLDPVVAKKPRPFRPRHARPR